MPALAVGEACVVDTPYGAVQVTRDGSVCYSLRHGTTTHVNLTARALHAKLTRTARFEHADHEAELMARLLRANGAAHHPATHAGLSRP